MYTIYVYEIFIAVWIIVAAEKDETRLVLAFLMPDRIDILQAHRITTVALHLGVFQGIIFFPQGSTMVKSIVNRMITVKV